ncbi:Tetratricopeptide repeat-containing protein [Flavobacterium succinicans]|uniref:Tetratricopeptide repeat-containing protein n=1 Tax=Flavobacterium succinicans TaxID=29536 RepID=A0A1I4R557_9FLAO|nr:tetratricopeptide repeat protein [Flavobacterium succinicans]SFM47401.1 Tetratricopeptide repeat-containing protein [Flavobacterium succinicans]
MNRSIVAILVMGFFGIPSFVQAQAEPEEIAMATNEFQDSFYEALKQKGIENYDKAIVSLEKCLKSQPEEAAVHYELGKNYFALKNFDKAYTSFEKAATIDPTNKWFVVGMYDVTYATKAYQKGIIVLQKLIVLDPKFKEDLVTLYMATNQLDKALELINQLNETVGKSDVREGYKSRILSQGKYQNTEIEHLIGQIEKFPKEESNYIDLIYRYSKSNEVEKMLEVAKKLEREIPTSEWAQVSLFKFHIEKNDGPKAVQSMNIVLASNKIDTKIKHRVLNEFLLFAGKNPQYESDLEKAIIVMEADPTIPVAKEIGNFYYNKKQWEKAAKYYEKAIKADPTIAMETPILMLQSLTELQKFEVLAAKAQSLMESYPSQPHFYYYAGLAYNQLQQYKKAKDVLETGVDYLIDNPILETNFYIQLGETFNGLGDMTKKNFYFSKANQLVKEKK